MQALSLRPSAGWSWIRAGWRLFRGQPLGFVALLFFYWLVLLTASVLVRAFAQLLGAEVIAAIGSLLVAILTPALTIGFMQACRAASASTGQSAHPLMLFSAFRAGRQAVRSLLMLGIVQMIALVLIVLLTSSLNPPPAEEPRSAPATSASAAGEPATKGATAPGQPRAHPQAGQIDEQAMRRQALGGAVQALSYLPVALLMWYAPMLAAWHGLSAPKALFFSVVAVWRNLGAFVVYGLGWLGIWVGMSFVFGIVAGLLGNPNTTAIVFVPVVMLLLTWMYCSMYPTYASVFVSASATGEPPADEPPTDLTSAPPSSGP